MTLAFHGVIGCHETDIDWYYDNRSHIHLTRRFINMWAMFIRGYFRSAFVHSNAEDPLQLDGLSTQLKDDDEAREITWNHMKITAHVTTNHVKCTKLRFSGLVHHHRQVVLPWRGRCATATLRKHRVALGQDAWQIWTASQGIAAYPSPDSIVPVESCDVMWLSKWFKIQWEFQDPEMEVLYRIKPYISGAYPLT